MKKDKRIDVRVSASELLQIKRHFGQQNVSDYVRNHLLEISKDSAIDTSNQEDLYELFKAFMSDEKVAKDIFNRFAKESGLGSCTDVVGTDTDELMVNVNGVMMTYSEAVELDRKGGG